MGRLEYEKGVHDVIAALPRIRRTHPGTTLTIAGEGTQQDWLVEQARKHKVLKATRFVGHLDHDELLAALHRADAAVLPSHYEPFGLAALEAAAAGTPLVTSNIGGLGEAVINGQTGVSCPPRDVAGWPRRSARCSTIRTPRSAAPRPPGNGSPRTSIGGRWPTRPRRCTWRPSAANASRCRGCPSSSTRCLTAKRTQGFRKDSAKFRQAVRGNLAP